MNYQQMTSPCGLDCFNCPAYLANDDLKLRIDMAERLGLPLEKATCNGYRNEEGIIAFLVDLGSHVVFNCTKKKASPIAENALNVPVTIFIPMRTKPPSGITTPSCSIFV